MFVRLQSVVALGVLGVVVALAAGFATDGLGASSAGYGPPTVSGGVFLQSSNPADPSDTFGALTAVSADESTIVAGAPLDDGRGTNAGAAYVFERPSRGWRGAPPAGVKIVGPDTAAGDSFGFSVSVSRDGNTIAVGAIRDSYSGTSRAGAAYVFTRPSGGWTATSTVAKLTLASPDPYDAFGVELSVSADGSTIAVGARGVDDSNAPNSGAVYVFTKPATGWADADTSAGVTLTPPVRTQNELFGSSVSMSANGDTIVVGMNAGPDPRGGDASSERAYVFTRPAGGWSSSAASTTLTQADATGLDEFGRWVSVSGDGDTIVVGALAADGNEPNSGAAYVFTKPAAGWAATSRAAKLTAADGAAGNYFGVAVSVNADGSMIAIGEPGRDSGHNNGMDSGTVHLFARPQGGWTTGTTSEIPSVQLPTEMEQGERGRGGSIGIGGNVVVAGSVKSGLRAGAWVYRTTPMLLPTATPTPPPPPPSGGGGGPVAVPTATPTPTATPDVIRPEVGLSSNFLTFTAAQGGDAPSAQTFTVWNTVRQTDMPFTVSSNASWLSFSPRTAASNSPQARVSVRVSANASGLAAGTHRGRLAISAPGAENTPRMVFATLIITSPTSARARVTANEETEITTGDSTLQVVVPARAASSNVDIQVTKLDADSPGAPPAEEERVVLAAEVETFASGSTTPVPMTYSPGVDLRFALPAADAAACEEGRVRVYRVDGDEWTQLEHRCETDASGTVWAVSTLTNFSTYVMTIDDALPTPTPEPTALPTATPEPTATSAPTAVPTATPVPATATPVPTATPRPATATPVPTATPRPATATPAPTATRTPTAIPTATPRPATATPVPSATSVPTAIPTATPRPATATPMPAATFTPVPPATTVAQAVPEPTSTPVAEPEVEDGGGLNMVAIVIVALLLGIAAAAAGLYVRRRGSTAG